MRGLNCSLCSNPGREFTPNCRSLSPWCFGELRQLAGRKSGKNSSAAWAMMRAYREYLAVYRRQKAPVSAREGSSAADAHGANSKLHPPLRVIRPRKSAERAPVKSFFSSDTRIPRRIVAAVTGEPIASVQRHMKAAVKALKDAHIRREKQNLMENRGKRKEAD